MIPDRFSVRGPHGTVPWVAVVAEATGREPVAVSPVYIVPSLVWARTREEAEGYFAANHRRAVNIRVFRVDPRHNLGSRFVRLTELA